jgi:hypothetical protein
MRQVFVKLEPALIFVLSGIVTSAMNVIASTVAGEQVKDLGVLVRS